MNKTYNKILIATDGSEQNKKAVTHAVELAKHFDAELHAVYVMDIKSDFGPKSYISPDVSGLMAFLRHEGETAIQYVEDIAKNEGLDIKKWIVQGHPAEEIMKLAEEQSVDLIVMGTLGRSGIEKFLLGSVADKVIRSSKIPVLIVRK
ncbi:Universal stress protein [uncultured archaeon]|nr:Universal stress protein [uncultured archaeon]